MNRQARETRDEGGGGKREKGGRKIQGREGKQHE
jgi:hypothetical protein